MADKTKLVTEAADLDTEFLRLINLDESEWTIYAQAETYVIKTCMQPYNDNYVFRVEASLDYPVDVVYDAFSKENRIIYDESFLTPEELIKLENNKCLERFFQREMFAGVVAPRDYINVMSYNPEKADQKFIAYKSVELEAYPPDDAYVRAWNYPSGVFMKGDASAAKTELVIIFQSDQKLWLPWLAINSGISEALGTFVDGLLAFLRDPDAAREEYKKRIEAEEQS